MKQRKKSKVVPFPNLEERLLKLGMEKLDEKNYREALQYFQQLESQTLYQEAEVGIVLCLLELGMLKDAKEKCKQLFNKGIGDYFEVLHIYTTILLQMKEYGEVVTTLEAVLEEQKPPKEYAESIFHLLQVARKLNKEDKVVETINSEIDDTQHVSSLFASDNATEQFAMVQKLQSANIRPYLNEVERFLGDSSHHPFIQSLLLQLLKEQEIDKEITVRKFGESITINPVKIPYANEQRFEGEVRKVLEAHLGQENPVLFELTLELWQRTVLMRYPLSLLPETLEAWAAALHKIGYQMQGMDLTLEELTTHYRASENEVNEALKILWEIEKIELSN